MTRRPTPGCAAKNQKLNVAAGVPRQQRGVVLLIALIMLVAMTVVGLSMLRSIGAGAGIAGNLAFKQNATSGADLGVEISRIWLLSKSKVDPQALNDDIVADGYYATWQDGFNPLTYDWANSKKLTHNEVDFIDNFTGKDMSGNEIRYVVHRLCAEPGAVDKGGTQKCANFTDYSTLSSKGSRGYGGNAPALTEQPYYRVTARVRGPRNTLSYIQIVMY